MSRARSKPTGRRDEGGGGPNLDLCKVLFWILKPLADYLVKIFTSRLAWYFQYKYPQSRYKINNDTNLYNFHVDGTVPLQFQMRRPQRSDRGDPVFNASFVALYVSSWSPHVGHDNDTKVNAKQYVSNSRPNHARENQ